MKKFIITLLTAVSISAMVLYINKDKTDTANYSMLVAVITLIFSVPLMKFLFPVTKELKIRTSEFYPHLFHKTADFFKKKSSNR
ncbi:hypothetical protein HHL23_12910 [Chryseobacterium sp. RP-3-3]|uniref:Uncharacterized protein n=1 Tax=Chryseobacterium antibioticum TaxID=2728847 RepID=A0A7Y0ANW7_9FLAO|nr:hypothetical protein [Chryseobacterium antibioticum]NML70685.1 hypothetical protein [Chryseobacterium antibioticum]